MSEQRLIDRFDGLLSDLDGVVYLGPRAIPGAPEALNRAREEGIPVMYVTNNASRAPIAVAEHISELGAPTTEKDVVSSAQAAARLLADQLPAGSRVMITGAEALANEIRLAGLEPVRSQDEQPVAVVQGFDPNIGWQDLAEAAYTLADPEVLWCATNTDWSIPRERGTAPGNGTLVAAVQAATGRTPIVAGKPEAPIFKVGAERMNAQHPAMIGDRMDTDIRGANAAGMPGIHVFTGVDSPEAVLAAAHFDRPTYMVNNLGQLFDPYPDPQLTLDGDRARATCGQAEAVAQGDTVTVISPARSDSQSESESGSQSRDLDGWRAACAAWWALYPDAHEVTNPSVQWQARS